MRGAFFSTQTHHTTSQDYEDSTRQLLPKLTPPTAPPPAPPPGCHFTLFAPYLGHQKKFVRVGNPHTSQFSSRSHMQQSNRALKRSLVRDSHCPDLISTAVFTHWCNSSTPRAKGYGARTKEDVKFRPRISLCHSVPNTAPIRPSNQEPGISLPFHSVEMISWVCIASSKWVQ